MEEESNEERYLVFATNCWGAPSALQSYEEALNVARRRIEKNNTNLYGNTRSNYEYAICKVVAVVRPVRTPTPVDVQVTEIDRETLGLALGEDES